MGDPTFTIPGIDIEAVAWTDANEISTLQRIDIGLYPLPLNEEWVLGKSGLKAIQYCALGIPTIATNVGCNNRVILNNSTGYLVETEQEWIAALEKLIVDPALRKQLGTAAREYVHQNYSIHKNAPTYLKILNDAIV